MFWEWLFLYILSTCSSSWTSCWRLIVFVDLISRYLFLLSFLIVWPFCHLQRFLLFTVLICAVGAIKHRLSFYLKKCFGFLICVVNFIHSVISKIFNQFYFFWKNSVGRNFGRIGRKCVTPYYKKFIELIFTCRGRFCFSPPL